jgi:ABC-type Fe3+-hydroxamate transport system substrate-binding protein
VTAAAPVRVVSLVPSLTETLLAWGIEPVACTRFCEQPHLDHVGGTRDPDVDAIEALHPTVVLMDREENREPDARALVERGLAVVATDVRRVADVAPALGDVARAVGYDGPLVPGDADAFARLADAAVGADPPAARRRTFVPIWRRPWMTVNADTYGSSLLALCGVETVFGDHIDRYPVVGDDEVRAAGAELVLLPSEPYPFGERHEALVATFAPVVRLVDGQDLFWWGVRTPAALTRLRRALDAP